MIDETDHFYLEQALAQAKKGLGFCTPNPAVGAVVVKNQQILAIGHHRQAGAPHAEVEALRQLSAKDASGATLYVTLEPCNHYGRTPPCTTLIIEKQITRVVYGFADPNPEVAGQGAATLQQAGIVCSHLATQQINDFYQPYAWYCAHKKPFVTGKLALSLDGKIAAEEGKRAHITGALFQEWVHKQRLQSDALLTTAKTIVRDNPYLNIRYGQTTTKPLYILDRHLKTPLDANILHTGAPCCFFYEHSTAQRIAEFTARGAQCIPVQSAEGLLALPQILQIIGAHGIQQLWLEAGGQCFENFVAQGLMNKAYLAVGLKWLNSKAQSAFTHDIFTSIATEHWFIAGDTPVCAISFATKQRQRGQVLT
jgi:diaminohydroxyphosphoribosylaminopyrimidine deaminase / 5-amino-6-(5-phosphoribosylamino)uracil reductase